MKKPEREKNLEAKLKDKVETVLGGWVLKLLPFVVSGLPDRLCLLPGGRLFFAEMKTTKKRAEKRQKIVHEQLRRLGFRVEVLDTSEKINEIVEEYETL